MQASDIVAVSSVAIAVIALAVSVYQSALIRRHNRQSVRPALQLRARFRPGERAGLRLVNAGLGPAVVTGSAVAVDGRHLGEYDLPSLDLLRGDDRPRPSATTFSRGAILATDYDEYLLSVEGFDPGVGWHAALAELVRDRLTVEIRYESLYGEQTFIVNWPARTPRED